MQIKRLVIENFKSIERIELIEPNPFTVFVGPNGSGKSNIFEALEFTSKASQASILEAIRLHGGPKAFRNRILDLEKPSVIEYDFGSHSDPSKSNLTVDFDGQEWGYSTHGLPTKRSKELGIGTANRGEAAFMYRDSSEQFFNNFKRLFINNTRLLRTDYQDDISLNLAASNLESVLKRLLTNSLLKEEIFEWLSLFISSFKSVEIDDRNELHWYEKGYADYFTKNVISDGTYNILALLTAVYQSSEPQFLCIEEPENGLHPQVLMSLVEFFRNQCEENGHHIWLNTHSEAVVRLLTTDEIILVDKREGFTKAKQIKGRNIYDIPTDEAWLTGALGGGLPW